MKALIISGGLMLDIAKASEFIKDADTIICADKGADYAKLYNVDPDIILGDMDSVNNKPDDKDDMNCMLFPSEKDYTDTQLAVEVAIETGAKEIDIICGTGTRLDHTMANIWLLLRMNKAKVTGRIIDDFNIISLCTKRLVLEKKARTYISILPISDTVSGITLTGFKYPLNNKNADISWTEGISNEIIDDQATIEIKRGALLVFQSRDKYF